MNEIDESAAVLRELGVDEGTLTAPERAALDTDGFVVLRDLLDPALLTAMRATVAAALTRARQDPTWHPGGTLHVDELLDAGPAADLVWTAPRLLAAVAHLLGPGFRMCRMHYRSPQSGFGAQLLHPDFAGPAPGRAQVATAIVALVDVTARNGATRVVPGSHRVWGFTPPKKVDTAHPDEQLVTMAAGSALVFTGHLWHSGTRNHADRGRDALQLSYARRSGAPSLAPEVGNATLDRLGPAGMLLL
jgi:ectoine hydroxylase-related dioxygenase (phytanoyl-CoA dioxygenase family)